MAKSKSLAKAIHGEVKEAVKEAKTGNVTTSEAPPQAEPVELVDLPTNARSHPPE